MASIPQPLSHLNSTSTVGSSTATAPTAGNSKKSWGKRVAHSASGDTYVRDLGKGNSMVTFVIWAN